MQGAKHLALSLKFAPLVPTLAGVEERARVWKTFKYIEAAIENRPYEIEVTNIPSRQSQS